MRPGDHRDRPCLFRNLVPLVLASASPRRRELLSLLGLEFEVFPAEIEETISPGKPPEEIVKELAHRKALTVARRFPEAAIIAADTLVVKGKYLLGKPKDLEEARQMLTSLSRAWHQVLTGVCIIYKKKESIFFTETKVKFRELSPEEIEAYLATGEPLDKAGAYAIQGLASAFVEKVEGSVTGVVGLPLSETVEVLLKLNLITPVKD
ncbi:Maf family protein [Thermosulfurimonas dismutans]|uniref:dTTP/UTP pyrophosphatase n=1 Tax=Thermosulfurimonas dismutans TaxID=999894 RepID=A0A179D606_9BACT|nr:Maf family protein [Thermosulfurimonas dismutans]OAQ21476.1 Septum formation protein Maf [Thermosulfurimonas dismutans]